MAWNDVTKDGIKEICLIDFNLLERQLENKGEFGWVSVGDVLTILKKKIKSDVEIAEIINRSK